MIQTNRIFEVSQALEIDYYGSFIIPFTFSKSQRQLIVTITNASNYNQQKMGDIIPFTEYGIGGQLDYFQKSIYAGNNYVETSAIDDYKLKFKPYKNGNYFVTIDEIIDSDFELMKANLLAPISQGRLTLTSNTPVLSSNVTNATTIFYTPYNGSEISIWDGSKWSLRTFTQRSLSLSGLPANTNYDVFVFDNAGTLTLEAVAWSNSGAGTSTRASALSWLNGVRVKDSDKRKYLGSFRTTATIGQTEFVNSNLPSSLLLKNEFNRIPLSLFLQEGATSHAYTTNTWRNYNNSANYKFNLLTIDNENIDFSFNNSSSNYLHITVSISNTIWNNIYWGQMSSDATNVRTSASLSTTVNGFNDFQIVERGNGTLTGYSIQLSAYLKTHY